MTSQLPKHQIQTINKPGTPTFPNTMASIRPPLFFVNEEEPEMDSLKNVTYNDDERINEKTQFTFGNLKPKQVKPTPKPDEMFSIALKSKHSTHQLNSASAMIEPILFTLKAAAISTENRVPLDLVCVLDTSSSMAGEKIALLIDSLNYLVDMLDENDRISIVKFHMTAERLTPLTAASKLRKPNIKHVIKSLRAAGGTDITSGMKIALKVLNERKYRNPVSSIFLLSDGLDHMATSGVRSLLDTIKPADNFTIHSFGYGSDHDPNLMSTIAKYRDGNFYFIQKLDTADECFVDALGGLISVVGQDASIAIRPVNSEIFPNVQIKKAFGGTDLWKVSNGKHSTNISQLASERSKNYVLELLIPKVNKRLADHQRVVTIAKALVTVKIPNSTVFWTKECELKINLVDEEEELPNQAPDKEVLNHYYRVRSAEIMVEARKLGNEAKYKEGRNVLRNFYEELSKSAVRKEPMVVGLLKDIATAASEMQPQLYETIGMHRLIQQSSSHMEERSNPYSMNSAGLYSNSVQQMMVSQAQTRKFNTVN